MNGRLDHFIRGVLGVLALVSVSGGAQAIHGDDGYISEVEGMYATETDAHDACSAAEPDGDCGTSSYLIENTAEDALRAIVRYSDEGGHRSYRHEYHFWYYAGCPDGTEDDGTGECVDANQCEFGEIQIGENAGQCRSDCDALGQGETDNYWGEGTTDGDYQNVEPGCDPQSGCGVTPARFHRLVDGSLVTEWTHTGSACSAGTDPLGVGESETDGCVGSGFSEFCYEEGTQEGNCGTFNGERVCFDAIPEDGACSGGSSAGDSYTCGTQGDYSIIPELPDGLTADEQGAVTMIGGDAEATVTVSGGSVVEGDAPLDEPQTPTEGDPGAGDHDGTGDGEGEEEGFCDKAPHLCDDSKAEDLPNKELPEDSTDISSLVGPGDYPNVISAPAACPEPQTFALPDSMGGASIDMPYTAFCDFATYINPLIVSLSYLAAFFIGLRILI